jgi:hypothetical protein
MFHLYRVWELDRLWRQGVWLPDWAPDFYFGYGYPLYHYTPLLPYVAVEALHLAGFDFAGALRVLLALGLPASGLTAYLFARQFFAPWAAMVAGVGYALTPYHLVNLYGRADLPEYLAAIWFPLILYGVTMSVRSSSARGAIILGFTSAALLLTHNISALLFAPVATLTAVALWCCASGASRVGGACALLCGVALGLALSAFFWIPAFLDRSFVQFGRLLHSYPVEAHFASVTQLLAWEPIQQYAPVFPFATRFGYQFGLWQTLCVAGAVVALPLLGKRLTIEARLLMAASAVAVAGALFMATSLSDVAWTHVPLINLAQFPWRFLGIAALPAAICAGFLASLARTPLLAGLSLGLVAIIAVSSLFGLRPIDLRVPEQAMTPEGYARFELAYRLIGTSAAGEYLPTTVHQRAETSAAAFELATNGKVEPRDALPVRHDAQQAGSRHYRVKVTRPTSVQLDSLAFPGWAVSVDNRMSAANTDPTTGLIAVALDPGEHDIWIKRNATREQTFANAVTLVALGSLVLALASWFVRQSRAHTTVISRDNGLAAKAAGMDVAPSMERKLGRWVPLMVALLCIVNLVLIIGLHPLTPPLVENAAFQNGATFDQVTVRRAVNGVVTLGSGSRLTLDVGWTPRLVQTEIEAPFVRLVGSDGQEWAMTTGQGAGLATSATLDLAIPAGMPPGVYILEAGIADHPQGGEPWRIEPLVAIRSTPGLPLAEAAPVATVIVAPSIDTASPKVPVSFGNVVDVDVGGVEFQRDSRGFLPSASPCPTASSKGLPCVHMSAGDSVLISVPLHDGGVYGHHVTASVHVEDTSGVLWTATDSDIAAGLFPATFWRPGQAVRDLVTVEVPSYVPPGRYGLALLLAQDGTMLSVLDKQGNPAGTTLALAELDVAAAEQVVPLLGGEPLVAPAFAQGAGEGLTLLGSNLSSSQLHPGDAVLVRSLWVAQARLPTDIVATWTLIADDGAARPLYRGPLIPGFPTKNWRPNVPVVGQWQIRIPATFPPGNYNAVVTLAGLAEGRELQLGRLAIAAQPPTPEVTPTTKIDALFGDAMRLTGTDRAAPFQWKSKGEQRLTLYWQGERSIDTSFKVSLQILNRAGKLVAQDDAVPAQGTRPTTGWLPGHQVADTHAIMLTNLQPGEYHVLVVVYDPTTGKRLALPDGGDAFLLTTVIIEG